MTRTAWRLLLVLSGLLVGVTGAELRAAIPQAPAAVPTPSPVRLFVDVALQQEAYVSQAVPVEITVGFDRVWLDEHAVPLIRQKVDLPFHVQVPWLLAAPERAVTWASPSKAQAGIADVRLAVGDRIVAGTRGKDVTRDGVTFETVRLRLVWLPLASGESLVAPVRVRYAYANEFREHLLRGREPVDRTEGSISSRAGTLRCLDLPKPQPAEFGGAVGEFELRAIASVEEVHVGEEFAVTVTVQGRGNLDRLPTMRAPKLDGFHVQGVVSKRSPGERVFVLDVVALRPGCTELPSVPFVAFSPAAKDYVAVSCDPVPLVVKEQLQPHRSPAVQELIDQDAAARQRSWLASFWRWGLLLLAVLFLWLGSRRMRRARSALAETVHQLRLSITQDGGADRTADQFEAVLARLAKSDHFGPHVWDGLQARGQSEDRIRSLRGMQEALDAARFGGPAPDLDQVMLVVDEAAAEAKA